MFQRLKRLDLHINVWALSFASLFNSISSEMLVVVLPLYLNKGLKTSNTTIGLVEGLSFLISSGMKIVSGMAVDKFHKHKWLTALGYFLAALSRPCLLLAHNLTIAVVCKWLEKIGKGLRGAPRDALLAHSVKLKNRGLSYSIHHAAQTVGCVLSLLSAFALLMFRAHYLSVESIDDLGNAITKTSTIDNSWQAIVYLSIPFGLLAVVTMVLFVVPMQDDGTLPDTPSPLPSMQQLTMLKDHNNNNGTTDERIPLLQSIDTSRSTFVPRFAFVSSENDPQSQHNKSNLLDQVNKPPVQTPGRRTTPQRINQMSYQSIRQEQPSIPFHIDTSAPGSSTSVRLVSHKQIVPCICPIQEVSIPSIPESDCIDSHYNNIKHDHHSNNVIHSDGEIQPQISNNIQHDKNICPLHDVHKQRHHDVINTTSETTDVFSPVSTVSIDSIAPEKATMGQNLIRKKGYTYVTADTYEIKPPSPPPTHRHIQDPLSNESSLCDQYTPDIILPTSALPSSESYASTANHSAQEIKIVTYHDVKLKDKKKNHSPRIDHHNHGDAPLLSGEPHHHRTAPCRLAPSPKISSYQNDNDDSLIHTTPLDSKDVTSPLPDSCQGQQQCSSSHGNKADAKDSKVDKYPGIPSFVLIVMIILALGQMFTVPNTFFILLADRHGLGLEEILLTVLAYDLVYTFITAPAGIISDKLSKSHQHGAVFTVGLGWIIRALVLTFLALSPGASSVVFAYISYGVYMGFTEGTIKALVVDVIGSKSSFYGAYFGIFDTLIGLADLSANICAGWFFDHDMTIHWLYFNAIGATICTIMLFVWRSRVEPSELQYKYFGEYISVPSCIIIDHTILSNRPSTDSMVALVDKVHMEYALLGIDPLSMPVDLQRYAVVRQVKVPLDMIQEALGRAPSTADQAMLHQGALRISNNFNQRQLDLSHLDESDDNSDNDDHNMNESLPLSSEATSPTVSSLPVTGSAPWPEKDLKQRRGRGTIAPSTVERVADIASLNMIQLPNADDYLINAGHSIPQQHPPSSQYHRDVQQSHYESDVNDGFATGQAIINVNSAAVVCFYDDTGYLNVVVLGADSSTVLRRQLRSRRRGYHWKQHQMKRRYHPYA